MHVCIIYTIRASDSEIIADLQYLVWERTGQTYCDSVTDWGQHNKGLTTPDWQGWPQAVAGRYDAILIRKEIGNAGLKVAKAAMEMGKPVVWWVTSLTGEHSYYPYTTEVPF